MSVMSGAMKRVRLMDRADVDAEEVGRLLSMAPDPTLCIDADGRILFLNDEVEAVLGYSREELTGRPVEVLVPVALRDGHRTMRQRFVDAPRIRPVQTGHAFTALRRDGTEIRVDIALMPVVLSGRPMVIATLHDLTDRLRYESALEASEKRFNAAFRHAPIGIAFTDAAGRILLANDALRALLGLGARDASATADVVSRTHPDDRDDVRRHLDDLAGGAVTASRFECRILGVGDRELWVTVSAVVSSDLDLASPTLVLQFEDVTVQRRTLDMLAHQATHDPLTGLPNRLLFGDRVAQALARHARTTPLTAVLYLDVDGFKAVNDELGHEGGDAMLLQLTGALSAVLRPSDTLARLGGDEFAVLAVDVASLDDAMTIAGRLRAAAGRPLAVAGTAVRVSVSVGVAMARPGMTGAELLRRADRAMYAAKAEGKDRCVLAPEDPPDDC